MKQSHRNVLEILQEKGFAYGWKVVGSTNTISLYKTINNQTASATLERINGGRYLLQPFVYEFKSRVSYFDYSAEERRWSRNKEYLLHIANLLKRCNLWDLIANKDSFMQVNENNPRVTQDKTKLQTFLTEILSENITSIRTIKRKPKFKK